MPDTASAQLRRVLHLIPRLADGKVHPYDQVARMVGTDTETLKQDLRSIAERFDDPGGFLDNIQIFMEPDGVSVMAMHFHRPMRLTLAELAARVASIAAAVFLLTSSKAALAKAKEEAYAVKPDADLAVAIAKKEKL